MPLDKMQFWHIIVKMTQIYQNQHAVTPYVVRYGDFSALVLNMTLTFDLESHDHILYPIVNNG